MDDRSWGKCYKLFIAMVLFYGLLLIYLTPAMQSPDENTHFYNSYAISHGQIFAEVSESGEIGRTFPLAIGDFVDRYQSWKSGQKMSLEDLQGKTNGAEEKETQFKSYWNADVHPIAYIASSTGMWLTEILGKIPSTPYNLLLAGRLANLILFAVISALAVMTTPMFKRIFMLLFLMPSTISLAASLNYDALLIPTVMLLFAWVMKFTLTEERIQGKDYICLVLISMILLAVKQAYFPLLLTVFAVSPVKFGTKKRYIGMAVVCMIAAAVFYMAYKIPSDMILQEAKAGNPLYSGQSEQIAYILSHIWQTPGMIIHSVMRMKLFYINSFFGILGRLTISYHPYYVCIYLLILAAGAVLDLRTDGAIGVKPRVLSVVAVVSAVFLIFMGTYIIWTVNTVGVGADWVDGVTGRYFIMLTPFVMLPFCWHREGQGNFGHFYKVRDFIFELGLLYANICLIMAVILVLLEYWI